MSYILAAALKDSPVCAVEHIERVFGTIVTNHVRIHVLRAVSSSVGLARLRAGHKNARRK